MLDHLLGRRPMSALLLAAAIGTRDVEAAQPRPGQDLGPAQSLMDALLAALSTQGDNVLISPLCLADALAPLLAGTSGATRQATSALGNSLAAYASQSVPQGSALKRAAALWLASDAPPGPGAMSARPLPTNQEEAVRAINAWTAQHTANLVPSVIERLPPRAPLVLTSALHFKGTWRTPFDPSETSQRPFRRPAGGPVQVSFLQGTVNAGYARRGTLQALRLLYAESGYSFLALAPAPGADANGVLAAVRRQQTRSILSAMRFAEGPTEVSIPRLALNVGQDLRGELAKGALAPAFAGSAEYQRLTTAPVRPAVVQHRVVLRLDETGTEAAAATAVTTSRSLRPPLPRFVADAPFLALIMAGQAIIAAALVLAPPKGAQ